MRLSNQLNTFHLYLCSVSLLWKLKLVTLKTCNFFKRKKVCLDCCAVMNQITETYWDSWALGLPFVPACWAAEVVQLRPPFASWSRASLPTLSGSCRSSQQEDDNTPTKERKEEWLNTMLFDDTPLWTFTMMIQHWAYSNIFYNHYGCDPKRDNQDQDKQLTLEFAARYMSPSTFLAYATKLCIRLSSIALGSGVGKMACTLTNKEIN